MKQPTLTQLILLMFLLLTLLCVSCNRPGSTPITPSPTLPAPTELPATPSPALPTATELPAVQRACQEQGGRWEVLGFSGWGCNPPTSDAGKVCHDADECEGTCAPDMDALKEAHGSTVEWFDIPNVAQELNSQGVEAVGFCSQWKYSFGCTLHVADSRYLLICAD